MAGGKFCLNQCAMFPSQAIIYLDVVKSRVQADDPLRPLYKGTLDCVRQSYKRSSSEYTSNFFPNLSPADQGGALSVLSWVQPDVEQGLHRQRGHLCSCGAAKQDVQE